METDQDIARLISHASICLHTILRLYYYRHTFESCDYMLVYWLVLIGNMAAESLKAQLPELSSQDAVKALQSTIVMCAQGLYNRGKNGFLYQLVYHAFQDRLCSKDVSLLRTYIPAQDTQSNQHHVDCTDAHWPIPIIKLNEDPQTASIRRLVDEHESLSLSPSDISKRGEGEE